MPLSKADGSFEEQNASKNPLETLDANREPQVASEVDASLAGASTTNVNTSSASNATPCILVIGMAGSGKTNFVNRMQNWVNSSHLKKPYLVNLDPAVQNVSFPINVDIRDTINYQKVMEKYGLGPNGGIMTSLNLFTTKFDQVLDLLESRASTSSYFLIDTPGQIEIFQWSASGSIITDAIASQFPTLVAYIVDTPKCSSPVTFMSSMLYACSILYKSRLPLIVVFNKTDVQESSTILEWMRDFEKFQIAIKESEEEQGYMSSLMNSMSLVLDEFYNHLDVVAVSCLDGRGMDDFFEIVDRKVQEYYDSYLPETQKIRAQQEEKRNANSKSELDQKFSSLSVNEFDDISKPVEPLTQTLSDLDESDQD